MAEVPWKTRGPLNMKMPSYQCRNSPLRWRHNDHDGGSNHQPHGCLLNRLFRRKSKITSKLRVTGLYVGNLPGPVNSPHKGPVTRKMFPFDDVIMYHKVKTVSRQSYLSNRNPIPGKDGRHIKTRPRISFSFFSMVLFHYDFPLPVSIPNHAY